MPQAASAKFNAATGQWETRITIAPGSAKRPGPRRLISFEAPDDAAAQKVARDLARDAKANPLVLVGAGETVADWFKLYLDVRGTVGTKRAPGGVKTIAEDRARWAKHMAPVVGHLDVGSFTRDDVEDLRDALDAKVRASELSWKTARHCWTLWTCACKALVNSKDRSLRRRKDNPCTGVEPTDKGGDKDLVYLYPSEFLALVSCPEVPLRWRQYFAVAVYTYARAGEVNALTSKCIDLERGVMKINASVNRITGATVDSTKSKHSRTVPIEPCLLPLLRRLVDKVEPGKHLFPWAATDRKLARQLHRCLHLAGVTRHELFTRDKTRKPLRFHDLRSSGLTWCAVRGDEPLLIMRRAGHEALTTTQTYIREAENLSGKFGEVFPTLPESLIGDRPGLASEEMCGREVPVTTEEKVEPPGIETWAKWPRIVGRFDAVSRERCGRDDRPCRERRDASAQFDTR